MKFSSNATTEIVFGDGSFDREIVRNALEKNKDKYCELLLFIPESGAKGKSLPIGIGIESVLKFVKNDVKRFSLNYIIFIDKEHCTLDYVECVKETAKDYGIYTSDVIKLNNEYDIYRFSCSVGSKKFRMYFVFLGYYCCIEDFILKICNEQIKEFRGRGCCQEYKKELKKIKDNCIEKAIDELFKEIENVLKDIRQTSK